MGKTVVVVEIVVGAIDCRRENGDGIRTPTVQACGTENLE